MELTPDSQELSEFTLPRLDEFQRLMTSSSLRKKSEAINCEIQAEAAESLIMAATVTGPRRREMEEKGVVDRERLEEKWVAPMEETRLQEALERTRFLALKPWQKARSEAGRGRGRVERRRGCLDVMLILCLVTRL
ncbi:cysteine-rich receptor-like protein kinase 9 [Pyrus ussuriensis x Pyrus communis]|uniref:Cysteine-rich receptor-like protein kinase 9 n=1 Tax=Pyrus ussuriensis x Pyrus communis TaxID=2448454 RepID=A0A5N5GA45_9ROSA|nr:cysteine-rich receptor-like protein kinase 9 [Pyrus ussuriensis x Pyrus communis]